MNLEKARSLSVGQRVVIRNIRNELVRSSVQPVPREWRDRTGSPVVTVRGEFVKCWVTIDGKPVPWPIEDVFTDLPEAKQRVARVARWQARPEAKVTLGSGRTPSR